jgi:murein L,D-transpeptidase YcbB/YkuD
VVALVAGLWLVQDGRLLPLSVGEAAGRDPYVQVEPAIAALLDRGDLAPLPAVSTPHVAEVRRLYGASRAQAVWIDRDCRPTAAARDALALLRDAADEGLDPRQYAADELGRRAAALAPAGCAAGESAARFDVALSAAMLRSMRHGHLGRVDPRALHFRVTVPPDDHDFAALLQDAVTAGRLRETIAELAPALPQYARLREMLRRYRVLAADDALAPWRAEAPVVRPGDRSAGLESLATWLAASGDLLASELDAAAGSGVYEGALVAAVTRFQQRHGLLADGIVGRATQAALATPLADRVRQIEWSLERLRWLPHPAGRLVVVNIPMFRLWAIDGTSSPPVVAFESDVVVGRALNTQTPVFDAWMTHVIFQPYWNVPRSIVRNELLPRIRRDPSYLAAQRLEIVRGQTDAAVPVTPTAEHLDALAAGVLRLRQRPGLDNALGLVKFVFPNAADVYLHDTPARSLFDRARRDFSHGCVRVARPLDLAEWALAGTPGLTRERIAEAMHGPPSRRVDLAAPVQVLLFYLTALVAPDGRMHFAEDIYGHDARLARALAAAAALGPQPPGDNRRRPERDEGREDPGAAEAAAAGAADASTSARAGLTSWRVPARRSDRRRTRRSARRRCGSACPPPRRRRLLASASYRHP